MSHRMVRAQLYLPKSLRVAIDRERRLTGESLSGFFRRALEEKVEAGKKEEQNLKALAQKVLGTPVKRSGWKGMDPVKWERQVRQEEEEHWLKRWDKAEEGTEKNKAKRKNVSPRHQRFYSSPK